jgi:hypothetical protein
VLAIVIFVGIVLAVAVAAFVVSGGDGSGEGPEGAVEAYFAAGVAGDCQAMRNLVVTTSSGRFPGCAGSASRDDGATAIASLDSTEVQQEDEDRAVVRVTVTIERPRLPGGDPEADGAACDDGGEGDGGETVSCRVPAEVHLVAENGSWKIRALTVNGLDIIRPSGTDSSEPSGGDGLDASLPPEPDSTPSTVPDVVAGGAPRPSSSRY